MQTEFSKADREIINNDYYHGLADRWYTADDDPIALLRAEARLRNPWISGKILKASKILDVGCGAGFLSNYLASEGHDVTGIDLSEESLNVARLRDKTKTATYLKADAYKLPFEDGSFDVITSTDFLEHVSEPKRVLDEVSRCLKPGGLFFFHTFNKTKLAHLMVIKCLEWFVKNTPDHLHVIDLFITPDELKKWMSERKLETREIHGVRPVIFQKPIAHLLRYGIVKPDFRFVWTKSLAVSYTGIAQKET